MLDVRTSTKVNTEIKLLSGSAGHGAAKSFHSGGCERRDSVTAPRAFLCQCVPAPPARPRPPSSAFPAGASETRALASSLCGTRRPGLGGDGARPRSRSRQESKRAGPRIPATSHQTSGKFSQDLFDFLLLSPSLDLLSLCLSLQFFHSLLHSFLLLRPCVASFLPHPLTVPPNLCLFLSPFLCFLAPPSPSVLC